MHYTYILKSNNHGKLYIGCSADLKARLEYHNSGRVSSTKPYAPWRIIYYEAHRNLSLDRKAESFYKKGQGRRQIKKKLGLD